MGKAYTPNIKSDKGKNLTKYVAQFVKNNKFNSIPKNVVELAKKHIFCLLYTTPSPRDEL